MEDKQTIIVLTEDGTEKEAEVLTLFNMKTTGKDYILYTLNEPDENDMVRIYASILVEKDGTYSFEIIESDEEWVQVKEIMKQMAKAGQEEAANQ